MKSAGDVSAVVRTGWVRHWLARCDDALVAGTPHQGADPVRRRRFALASLVLLGSIAIVFVFVPYDLFVTGYVHHAVVQALAGSGLLAVFLWMRRSPRIDRSLFAASMLMGAAILFVIFTGKAEDSVLAWAPVFPAIPCFLLGLRRGFYVTVGFYALLFAGLGLVAAEGGEAPFNGVSIANAVGANLAMVLLVFYYELGRATSHRHLEETARTDPLTGILNRRGFQERFEAELARAQRAGAPLSLLVIDIDRFKAINDRHGHDAGDEAIRHVASLLAARIRRSDVVGRLGGEEFGVLLPDTPLPWAAELAETLRQTVEAAPVILPDLCIPLTISLGAAESGPDCQTFPRLFSTADQRLYRAKKTGRNRVVAE